jgi:NAD(P)-dependent dehydrogenase (short-subunit alcohol dehydrogenase family)
MTPPRTTPLAGRVAVVAGATRGAGRGIARMLGEAGATVYCTGRSSRSQPNTSDHHYAGRPETIEETAELVTAAGGAGVPVRVDYTADAEVEALMARVRRERRRLDVLVNVLTGVPVTSWQRFWKLDLAQGRAMIDRWLWPHLAACRYALPLMVKRKAGLVVEVVEQDRLGYHGQFYFDLFEILLKRLAYALAEELAPHGVTALAITPGFMRTEAILEGFGVAEANWRDAIDQPKARQFGWEGSETPCFVGRAVAALAADPALLAKSGGLYSSWGLAEEYGFTDLDGSRPNLGRFFGERFPEMWNGRPSCGRTWQVTDVPERAPAADAAGRTAAASASA